MLEKWLQDPFREKSAGISFPGKNQFDLPSLLFKIDDLLFLISSLMKEKQIPHFIPPLKEDREERLKAGQDNILKK